MILKRGRLYKVINPVWFNLYNNNVAVRLVPGIIVMYIDKVIFSGGIMSGNMFLIGDKMYYTALDKDTLVSIIHEIDY